MAKLALLAYLTLPLGTTNAKLGEALTDFFI